MGKIRTAKVAGLALALGLSGLVVTDQAKAAGADCEITVTVDPRVAPVEVMPEILVVLEQCGAAGDTLHLDVTSSAGALPRQSTSADDGEHLLWSGAEQVGDYRAIASVGQVRSEPADFRVVAVPTIAHTGWKVVEETTYAWGTFDVAGPIRAWTEVWVEGRGWLKSQERETNARGGYSIPLTYGNSTPGLYRFRVAGLYPSGDVLYTDPIILERVGRPTAGTAGIKEIGLETNVWGKFDVYRPTEVWTEILVGDRWLTSQTRTTDRDGHYEIPLTYGAHNAGVYRWRVAGWVDGTVMRTREFTLRRVATPTATSAGLKRVGEAANVWGTLGSAAEPMRVWTEAWLGDRWVKSQERVTNDRGGYAIPLTYGANSPGTVRWRVGGIYPEGILYSGEFTLRRY